MTIHDRHLRQEDESTASMIRKLVDGVVHDFRPPQLHMFLTAADTALIDSPALIASGECARARGGCDSDRKRACA